MATRPRGRNQLQRCRWGVQRTRPVGHGRRAPRGKDSPFGLARGAGRGGLDRRAGAARRGPRPHPTDRHVRRPQLNPTAALHQVASPRFAGDDFSAQTLNLCSVAGESIGDPEGGLVLTKLKMGLRDRRAVVGYLNEMIHLLTRVWLGATADQAGAKDDTALAGTEVQPVVVSR